MPEYYHRLTDGAFANRRSLTLCQVYAALLVGENGRVRSEQVGTTGVYDRKRRKSWHNVVEAKNRKDIVKKFWNTDNDDFGDARCNKDLQG